MRLSHKPLINRKNGFLLKGPVTKSLILLDFHDGAFQADMSKG